MKRILVVSGSRADYGLLEWPIKKLEEDGEFEVIATRIWDCDFAKAFDYARLHLDGTDLLLLLGDRYEILAVAIAAHLQRIPIAHIGGGDVTEGSYDDAMRDCISRMATIHFVTSTSAMARLSHMGYRNVHLVGNPGIDFIRHAQWRGERPIAEPYVVVSYQAETIDKGTLQDFDNIRACCVDSQTKRHVFIMPNPDRGNETIRQHIEHHMAMYPDHHKVYEFLPHAEYLNLIAHCDELIGNSSSMLYEAPELGVKTRMIGKRQKGRTIPWGDGHASERIVKILRYTA